MCNPFTWRPGLNRTLWRRLFDEPKRGFRLTAAKRWLLIVIVASVCFILYYSHKKQTRAPFYGFFRHIPEVTYQCPTLYSTDTKSKQWRDHSAPATRAKIDPKVLLFVETTFSKLGRDIQELLVHNRMKYKLEVAGSALPMMTNGGDKGRFGVIVFENYTKYIHMDKWNKELIDKYCKEFNVGILGFMPSEEVTRVKAQLKDVSLLVDTNVKLKDAYLNPNSEVLRLTRAGDIVRGSIPNEPNDTWTVFTSNHSTYEPIAFATKDVDADHPKSVTLVQNHPLVTVVQDRGELDGIRRVLFGGGLKFWLHRLLILDAISYLSRGRLSVSLKRFILVDIDDIFVGEKGTRLRQADVEAILHSQDELRSMIPGFKFNMGFSGKYFHNGDDEENLGDDLLIANSDKFMWFGHMWNHIQPHLYSNLTQLKGDMQRNKDFAKEHGIPVTSGYSVSPHHSGVYPVHEPLYEAWKKVWNIKVTSTEEYPHLRPARLRRGFIHRNIMVLPRQTCGLFTHTIFIDLYPGGRAKLEESIFGGELFQTIVFNSVNVFMTHMSNYGNDRLGLYTFESVTRYLNCWTNLQMITLPPDRLAEKYFKMHPDELDPIWGNPCDDPRHKKIWSSNSTCDAFPQFLVVGPQKTGTTALYSFLSLHPSISSNTPSPETFEEVQFFNGKNYYKGLDWYMKYFVPENLTTAANETISNNETIEPVKKSILFEKSATYFDNEMVPRRAHSLLPKAKIIVLMISPAKRAYSWFQHMRAHKDPTAVNYTFYDILTAPSTAPKNLRDLKNRCLNPGRYAQHIDRWLSYYPSQQMLILDGDELKHDPVTVMNRVQQFLQITPVFDYSSKLRYDEKKGFYCQVVNANKNKCLGRGKGRHYDQMDPKAAKFLQTYYLQHNSVLVKLLKRLDVPTPQWLKEDLSLNV